MKRKLIPIISSILLMFSSFQSLNAINFYDQNLNSDSVYMVNYDLNQSVAEKNIDKKRSPASLTKIVTFLVTYDNCKNRNETKFSVNKEILDMMDPDSSGSKLKEGEEFSVTDLLHTMMISSSGYAAMTLAYHVGQGDVGKFVDMMNKKIEEIGCENTHFENPDGIYAENQYSTARDMYKIANYAMKNKEFLDIVGKSEYKMFGDERDPVTTTNYLIDRKRGGKYYYPWAKGIKTGHIDDAGRCLISYASKDGKTYLLVVMGGPDKDENGKNLQDNTAMLDSINLYNWAFENLKIVKICEKYSPLSEVPLNFAWGRDKLILSSDENRYAVVPKEADPKEINLNYDL
ncbi:MAG: D-alanyl-D-alanine carboxypeptidase, partial [Clostridia bacterium]|nr:D-alanyl-D-alanine carboxypeptidase [Clostridia bacterium]